MITTYYTASQFAELIGISSRTIHGKLARNNKGVKRVGNKYVIDKLGFFRWYITNGDILDIAFPHAAIDHDNIRSERDKYLEQLQHRERVIADGGS